RDRGGDGILAAEGGVVGLGQGESPRINDRDVGVEHRVTQSHADHFGGDALTFGGFDDESIDVFVVDHATDRGVELDRLGAGEVIVGFFLGNDRIGRYIEGAELGDARGGTDADGILADLRVLRDLYVDFDVLGVDRGEARDGDAGGVEEK